jgi:type IV secretion system protein VirB10
MADEQPDLSIRSAARPVKSFSKKAIIIGLGGATLLILASLSMASGGTDSNATGAPEELYSTEHKPTAAGLSDLPASYADLEKVEDPVPQLGPPLPGDLGGPILAAQREGRLPVDPLHAAPASDINAAELEAARISAIKERGLFFETSANRSFATDTGFQAGSGLPPNDVLDPFEVIDRLVTPEPLAVTDQDRKLDFIETPTDESIYNPHRIETPISPWQVMSGSVIPATLITAINSDLPGQVVAQVTEPIYDTVTGDTLLIPQGTRVIGRYDSAVAFGQSRALIVWNRLIMPDGSSIRIENLPAVDGRGNAGLSDRVNNHAIRIFSAAALSSLISIGAELGDDDDGRITRALRDAAQDGAQTVGQQVVQRQLAVQPTITIRRGWRLRILVHQDIILSPYGASQ